MHSPLLHCDSQMIRKNYVRSGYEGHISLNRCCHQTQNQSIHFTLFDPPYKTRHEYVNMLVSFLFDSLLLAVMSASWSLPHDNNSLLIALSLVSKLLRRKMGRMCYEIEDTSICVYV